MLQRADHRAHLPMQEGAGAGADMRLRRRCATHVEPVQRAHRIFRLAIGVAKGREIVPAEQELRRLVHGLGVEPAL